MNSGKTIFSQLMDFLPSHEFRRSVDRYNGNYKPKHVSCWDQFLCMAFAQLTYRESLRWQVELFFKWIKQHLRIKAFYGTTENALKTQIWIAISIYVLVAIVKKRLNLKGSLYRILQILSVTMFEKTPLSQALSDVETSKIKNSKAANN